MENARSCAAEHLDAQARKIWPSARGNVMATSCHQSGCQQATSTRAECLHDAYGLAEIIAVIRVPKVNLGVNIAAVAE